MPTIWDQGVPRHSEKEESSPQVVLRSAFELYHRQEAVGQASKRETASSFFPTRFWLDRARRFLVCTPIL